MCKDQLSGGICQRSRGREKDSPETLGQAHLVQDLRNAR